MTTPSHDTPPPATPPRTDWQETIPADEAERVKGYGAFIGAMQDAVKKKSAAKGLLRGLHAKGLLGARAELTVLPGLPAFARVGMFAEPRTFAALVRFSNGSGAVQSDRKGDVRGLAIKVLGVAGRKLIPGLESATTQDFLVIRSPTFVFRDAAEFVFFVGAAARPWSLLPRAIARLGFGRTFEILRTVTKGSGQKVTSLAHERFWSAAAIKFGPYAVHYGLKPAGPSPDAPSSSSAATSPNHLGDDLRARLKQGPIAYDFLVQFYADSARTPIEDGSVEWSEADAPFLPIARLVLPKQDLDAPDGVALGERIEALSFDPWHATEDFRPLGNIMRARKEAYRVSVIARGAAPEPTDGV